MHTVLVRRLKNPSSAAVNSPLASRLASGLLLWALLAGWAPLAVAQQDAATIGAGTITTFAGKYGSKIHPGVTDNQPATSIQIGSGQDVNAVAIDPNGNVYVAVGNISNGPDSYSYVGIVYVGGTIPPLLKYRTASPTPGNFYYIVGDVEVANNSNLVPGLCIRSSSGSGNTCG